LAVGYTASLVQARRFEQAAIIARRVIEVAPDRYEAHANLATALYELKRFPEALVEFRWLSEAKPDLAATYFFIATAHDFLGEYPQALMAYETFLARADAQSNKLEIEKVNLRLPVLRNQVKRGEGAKQKKGT
jgi:tetratricopeptide (TPR) repeat protein